VLPIEHFLYRTGFLVAALALVASPLPAASTDQAPPRIAPAAGSEMVRLQTVLAEPLPCGSNLLSNPGFEETKPDGSPAGWQWDRRNTDAACVIDRAVAHRGGKSLLLTNGTAYGAHVYAMLWRTRPAALTEGKPCTMSAWVKSDAPGIVSLVGGADWQVRAPARATGGQWQRIWKTFSPGPKDCHFTLRINTESPTRGVWIDDVKLEEGTAPTPDPITPADQAAFFLEPDEPEVVVQGDGPFSLTFTLSSPRPISGMLEAVLGADPSLSQRLELAAGVWRLRLRGEAAAAADQPRALTLRLARAGNEKAEARTTLRFYSAAHALGRLAALTRGLPAIRKDLQAVQARGEDISDPQVTATVLENFIGYAEEDARRGEVRRALEQVEDLEQMATRLTLDLRQALAGSRRWAAVPRWTGAQRPVPQGSSFLGPAELPGGRVAQRPLFFTGYGHFGQVVADLEKWRGYGANIIQIEVGPSSVFPRESVTNEAPLRALRVTLDRAQKAGVAVCLLISPHYLPGWAREKWPHLRQHREGFLQYCLHAPEGRELLRRFIAVALPPLRDHPALHSICLSNEPVNEEEPCEAARQQWQAWLEQRHGTPAELNRLCASNFASFAEAPLPNPFAPRPHPVLWMDYIRFNQEFFADWHQAMARDIHSAAPGLPVHAKAMTWTMVNDGDIRYGVDATLFGRFSDINGNDSVNFYNFGEGDFAQGWQMNALGHDLQRSVRDAPVFNTENHLIVDRETRRVPAAHIRAGLWQAAVHGQSATTIWVWERTFDPKSDFAGSIMHRPACAEAVGLVNHDLNRAALEVTALQQARPDLLLLQSVSASVWDAGGYSDCLGKLYTALAFTGLKLGFISERQLESGLLPDAPLVFVPAVRHLSAAAAAGLRRFQGRLVLVGEGDLLARDEYDRPSSPELEGEKVLFRHGPTSARDLHARITARLPAWNLHPAVELRGTDPGPVWGVEWRSADTPAGVVLNLCNYLKTPVTVSLRQGGRETSAQDLLNGAPAAGPVTLQPLEVRLLRLPPAARGANAR
jgi:hypothetical protein